MADKPPCLRITSQPLSRNPGGYTRSSQSRLEIDGKDISNIVTAVRIEMSGGKATTATIEILADAIEIDTDLFEVVRPHLKETEVPTDVQ